MRSHTVKLKEVDMLCNKCVLHVLKVLTKVEKLQELEVDLNKKIIKIVFNDDSFTKERVTNMVNNALLGIKSKKLLNIS